MTSQAILKYDGNVVVTFAVEGAVRLVFKVGGNLLLAFVVALLAVFECRAVILARLAHRVFSWSCSGVRVSC